MTTNRKVPSQAAIGKNIAQARQLSLMSQVELAKAMGISRSQIASLETGRSRLYADQLFKLSLITGRSMSDLLK